ncbi:hypothetical protein N658DRAFT_521097 [Parathielavia hyrcaniae]|uniref:AAA+ ATPase domain-containing protein n=1 Tax=Parathielavia hyrcaniae TaxID=113614 RepID=A0AAN6Q915_9PEZI|nr:hypothetical protein N658DRAFT_521097 [Parathielavia hyrcaniae]
MEEALYAEQWLIEREKIPLKVDVDFLDFDHFKNRYSEDEGLAIIEVLCGVANIARHVKQFIRTTPPIPNLKHAVDGKTHWIQRIRVQSPQLIQLLSRLTGNAWPVGKPRTFAAPFLAFHHYLPQLKRCLELLEEELRTEAWARRRADAEKEEPDSYWWHEEGGHGLDLKSTCEPMEPEDAVIRWSSIEDPSTALAHLGKFVDFIERHVEPHWDRAVGTSQRKFRFADLYMAFRPGELLHVGVPPEASRIPGDNRDSDDGPSRTPSTKASQTVWRLYCMAFDPITNEKPDIETDSIRELDIHAYYWDYDGSSYVPVVRRLSIRHFEGERDIASLEIYPLRFAKEAKKTTETLVEQGGMFVKALQGKHLAYDGWTLPRGPSDDPYKSLAVEYIDSDVIIDVSEGYKSDSLAGMGPSTWVNALVTLIPADNGWRDVDDEFCPQIMEKVLQALKRREPSTILSQDLIRGKGSSLVILLHGVPGVGKTATAEAVAQHYKRPLFVITCGDLGLNPKDVESGLKNIFRLAQLWDCILLLDEADIFLSRRELKDLERNALVSVFLRVLEYYSGILFLTTNRKQTLSIFRVNIEKLERIMAEKHRLQAEPEPSSPEPAGPPPAGPLLTISKQEILRFAERHFNHHYQMEEQWWDGRQIRNAFQIAYSLAEFELLRPNDKAHGGHGANPASNNDPNRVAPQQAPGEVRLGARHFEMVAQTIAKFEDYLLQATTMSDRDRAKKMRIRRDDYVDQHAVDDYPAPQQPSPCQQQQRAPPPPRSPRPSPGLNPPVQLPAPPGGAPHHQGPPSATPARQATHLNLSGEPPGSAAANTGGGGPLTTPSRSAMRPAAAAVGRNDSGYGSNSGWSSLATPRTPDPGLQVPQDDWERDRDGHDDGPMLGDGVDGVDGGHYDHHESGYRDADLDGVEGKEYGGEGFDAGVDDDRYFEDDAQLYGGDYRYGSETEQVGRF